MSTPKDPFWSTGAVPPTFNEHGARDARTTDQPTFWARWEYSDSEWQLFDRLDWGRARRRCTLYLTAIAVLYLAGAGFFETLVLGSLAEQPGLLIPAIFIPLLLLLPIVFLVAFFVWLPVREAWRRRRARRHGPKRVTIGNPHLNDQEIWLAGTLFPLQELFVELRKVKLSSRPPFVLSIYRRHSIRTGSGTWRDATYLPVPQGREEEARRLVERFQMETIGASRRRIVPREPE